MQSKHWTLDEIPWEKFDPSKVRDDQLRIAKAAAMVEYNAADYVAYLENVFADDPDFTEAARAWGLEEVQHGQALSKWAALADPEFDFDQRFGEFRRGFRLDLDATDSVRGSRAGELIARCMVEVGTSSYYSALGDGTDEPVLRAVCRKIASDELRHYKLFYDHLKRYVTRENLSTLRRVRVALGRIMETEDDELSYAYFAANANYAGGEAYDRKLHNGEYMRRAFAYYRDPHIDRGMAMIFKAVGLRPHTRLFTWVRSGAQWMMRRRQRQLARMAASASATA